MLSIFYFFLPCMLTKSPFLELGQSIASSNITSYCLHNSVLVYSLPEQAAARQARFFLTMNSFSIIRITNRSPSSCKPKQQTIPHGFSIIFARVCLYPGLLLLEEESSRAACHRKAQASDNRCCVKIIEETQKPCHS